MPITLAFLLGCVFILTGILLVISPGKPEPFLDKNNSMLEGSISEKVIVNIGGVEQGMFIKGKNTKNPVLLFLHGGPGMPEYFLAEKYPTGLEDHFTVCYWEQRGAGLSYNADISAQDLTAEQLVSDTIEATNYLRERFGQDKIYLMAHSWGSFLGIQAAAQAPQLYIAYIGVAQISQMAESEKLAYTYILEQYTAAGNNEMIKKLKNYPVLESDIAVRSFFVSLLRDRTMHELGIGTMHNMKSVITGIFIPVFQCRAYTLKEKITVWRAKAFLRNDTKLIDQLFSADLTAEVSQLKIPAYFISGKYDYTVNYDLSKVYLKHLQAPVKGFYTFEQSAHSPMFEEPEKFTQIMLEDVLNKSTALADTDTA
ncbi:MAG: alpha/beta hydrolase [Negativicutes bacterium]|nr:alpha/beta hydrolase [Negativicutes bacterium]